MKNFTISFTRGDNYNIAVKLKNKQGDYLPFVSGDTVYFTVRDNSDSDIAIQKIITGFCEDGSAVIRIFPEDTKNLSYTTKKYDIEMVKADGWVQTLVKYSDFVLEKEVTRHE